MHHCQPLDNLVISMHQPMHQHTSTHTDAINSANSPSPNTCLKVQRVRTSACTYALMLHTILINILEHKHAIKQPTKPTVVCYEQTLDNEDIPGATRVHNKSVCVIYKTHQVNHPR